LPEEIPRIPLLLPQPNMESIISPLDRRSEAYRHAAAEVATKHPPPPALRRQPIMTLPNVLTFIRLIMVPVMLALWEVPWRYSPVVCAIMFIGASLTDWLDGYLARRLKITTVFGAFLDPVADKIMVCTALILLTTSPPPPIPTRIMVLPVAIMVCREITMSSLREWAAAAGGSAQKAVKVNSLGKWKTALQMVAMSVLLVVRQPAADMGYLLPPFLVGTRQFDLLAMGAYVCLWAATVLAMWSLAIYMSNVWVHFVMVPHKEKEKEGVGKKQ